MLDEREVEIVDEIQLRDKLIVRNQERFTDHDETDAEIMYMLSANPTLAEMVDVIQTIQKKLAAAIGVALEPSPLPPPRD